MNDWTLRRWLVIILHETKVMVLKQASEESRFSLPQKLTSEAKVMGCYLNIYSPIALLIY
jgi:hypothetical protein